MDVIAWLLRIAFFVLMLWFALQNFSPVPLNLGRTLSYDVPLIAVILACFVAGVLAGTLALVPHLLRQRRRITALSRTVDQRPVAPEPVPESLTDVARRVGAVGGLEAETRAPRS
jgi:lipopolysaccharide assembly protein A